MRLDYFTRKHNKRVARREYIQKWHRWYAWYPVDVSRESEPDVRWLEYVERRADVYCNHWTSSYEKEKWEYRPLQEEEKEQEA